MRLLAASCRSHPTKLVPNPQLPPAPPSSHRQKSSFQRSTSDVCLWSSSSSLISIHVLCHERRILALKRLGGAAAPALRHGLCHGIGEDVLLTFLHPVEDGSRNGLRRGLRDVVASGHIRVHGAEQGRVNPHALSGQKGAQRLR